VGGGRVGQRRSRAPPESDRHGNSEAVVYLHVGMHSIVEGMCGRFGIPGAKLLTAPSASTSSARGGSVAR